MVKELQPRPIGYVEVQRGWVGEKTADEIKSILDEVFETTAREHPHLKPHGSRIEFTYDGANVQHATLYAGFEPRRGTTPPLNPRNLNDAAEPQIGNAIEDFSLGMKERKF